jgi:DNA polymerase III sliding clamp (beta) subunit (PCNA family)
MKAIIETSELKRLIKATAKFISKDENRQLLQYIKLTFSKSDNLVKAVAIDDYRMSIESAKCHLVEENFTALIKPYLPVGVSDEYATIELTDGKCLIDIGGGIVGFKQIEGESLDATESVKSLEAFPVKYEVCVNPKFLLDALNSVKTGGLLRESITIQLREGYGAVTIKTKTGARYVCPIRK